MILSQIGCMALLDLILLYLFQSLGVHHCCQIHTFRYQASNIKCMVSKVFESRSTTVCVSQVFVIILLGCWVTKEYFNWFDLSVIFNQNHQMILIIYHGIQLLSKTLSKIAIYSSSITCMGIGFRVILFLVMCV